MIIKTLATGSTGNCYMIDDGETRLLIELGIRFKDIQKALNFETSSIQGALISHSHQDHCKGVSKALDASMNIYMSKATATEIGIEHNRIKLFKSKEHFRIGSFTVLPFPVKHDVENHGFLIVSVNSSRLLFATDTYYVRFLFKDLNYIMIECNYSEEILNENIESGRIPGFLGNRIRKSHFSLENLLEFFKANDISKVREIHLLHLSDTNSNEELFKQEVQKVTGKLVVVAK